MLMADPRPDRRRSPSIPPSVIRADLRAPCRASAGPAVGCDAHRGPPAPRRDATRERRRPRAPVPARTGRNCVMHLHSFSQIHNVHHTCISSCTNTSHHVASHTAPCALTCAPPGMAREHSTERNSPAASTLPPRAPRRPNRFNMIIYNLQLTALEPHFLQHSLLPVCAAASRTRHCFCTGEPAVCRGGTLRSSTASQTA